MTVYQVEGIIASIPGVTDKIINWFKGEYRQANSSDRLKKEVMMQQMMQYYISALKTTGKDKPTDLEPPWFKFLKRPSELKRALLTGQLSLNPLLNQSTKISLPHGMPVATMSPKSSPNHLILRRMQRGRALYSVTIVLDTSTNTSKHELL
ncbi:uncharacterized protein LACBIDRAFT_329969 [Laccaria bicolor S238N-H82]|nr:uncharacterized protein LACBIDRAFT_329969 [Laccaria bicolor S238N-H82]EDR05171.1 predicted protein [Laccaria bicolor S238N-H82]|eukprot:XP_001884136.1 predicted protein [Laccaria bicolor S238N-H82]